MKTIKYSISKEEFYGNSVLSKAVVMSNLFDQVDDREESDYFSNLDDNISEEPEWFKDHVKTSGTGIDWVDVLAYVNGCREYADRCVETAYFFSK